MSFLSNIANKVKLASAKKKLTAARQSDGSKSNYLYESANKLYEEISGDVAFKSEAMHFWGFSLYNQGITKSEDEAVKLMTEACEKFSASHEADRENIKPAIDWGVALMALAGLKGAAKNDALYDEAIEKFQIAEEVFFGSASYNLACIYAIRGDEEACKQALEDSRDTSSLPSEKEVLNDADLDNVKETEWFKAFTPTIKNRPALRKTRKQLAAEAEPEAATALSDAEAAEEKQDEETGK